MESVVLTAKEKQSMISSFLEIAVGQSAETARHEQARNIDGSEEEVRPPLPVKREVLYDDAMLFRASRIGYPSQEASSLVAFRNFDEEMKRPGVWELNLGAASSTKTSRDNLASLYSPPFALMLYGPFDEAKITASDQEKWLLVNLQSAKEFSSHMLNRDTWSNEAVAQTIRTNFIFWQIGSNELSAAWMLSTGDAGSKLLRDGCSLLVYDDTPKGRKVCTYYNLDSIAVVLVIDPITGQKMCSWNGMVHPDRLLEDLLPFMDGSPKNHHITPPHKCPCDSSQISTQKAQGKWVKTDFEASSVVSTAADVVTEEDEELRLALAASLECKKEDINPTSTNSADNSNADKEAEACSTKKHIYLPLPKEPKGDKLPLQGWNSSS